MAFEDGIAHLKKKNEIAQDFLHSSLSYCIQLQLMGNIFSKNI